MGCARSQYPTRSIHIAWSIIEDFIRTVRDLTVFDTLKIKINTNIIILTLHFLGWCITLIIGILLIKYDITYEYVVVLLLCFNNYSLFYNR